ncbi:Fatty acid synthase [Formica fusca]
MIIQKTGGRGVDIVLNSLVEVKLQASIRCLAKGGRFLEIGKFDMISNNPLELFAFSKGISFHSIILGNSFYARPENKIILSNKLIEGLKEGAIKPLCRKVFERDEIEVAFRYMAAGKHIGKYIMEKMKDQKEFLIVGYSFGSLIAIELARLLQAKNFVGRLILIDGAADWMQFLIGFLNYTSQQELQNDILIHFMKMYLKFDNEMPALELNECSTWEEKLELFTVHFSQKINVLSIENQKFLCTTVYDHIIAVQDYDISLLPPIKSSIILLKPTLMPITFPDEDYGLHKVTESAVQIHYVQGTHITMMDKIASFINEGF